jgi:hypothetical protein
MERVIRSGENGVIGDLCARDRRAKAIAENFGQWASKTPSGLVIRGGIKDLLSADTGERLAWSQVNRAREALADLTNGAIALKRTSKGWALVGQPDDHRLRSLLASTGP